MNIEENKKDNSISGAKVTINGEPLSPNEPVTGSQTENAKVTIITDDKTGLVDTQADTAEKPPVSEADPSYANKLADRIITSARSGKLRKVGVAQEDFEKLNDAGFIRDGFLKGSGIIILIQVDADTTNTYWDRTEQ